VSDYSTFSHACQSQLYACQSVPVGPAASHAHTITVQYRPVRLVAHHAFNCTNTFHVSPMATLGRSTFQSSFSDALRVYKKRIKIDLLLHPLAVRLQPCDSPHAVISVLREQARAIDQSLTNLLHPTVNVIYALSSSLQEGVGLVNICACSFGTCPAPSVFRYYPQRKSSSLASVSSS
jgi:hypothetical protein